MSKKIGPVEQKRRMYRKMLQSLSNKMCGTNILWFNSLSQKAKYALLFKYNESKQDSKFKFKHFIDQQKPKFIATTINIRNAAIEHLIQNKK